MKQPTAALVFSDRLNRRFEVETTRVAYVEIVSGYIVLSEGTGDGEQRHKIPAPSEKFVLEDLASGRDAAWAFVAYWLAQSLAEDAIFVFDSDHHLRDFALFAKAVMGVDYCIRVSRPPEAITVKDYAVFNSALAFAFDDEATEAAFRNAYLAPYRIVDCLDELSALRAEGLSARRANCPNNSGKKKLLIVAYFSGPCRTVGVQRISYWFDEIERLSDGEIEVHLATAIDWTIAGVPSDRIHFVPDLHVAALLDKEIPMPPWATRFVQTERNHSKHFSTFAYYWRIGLERYFGTLDCKFDWVILSGNPFAYFDFATFAKVKWYADVLLDYRDPFANNPRVQLTPTGRQLAQYVERGYNFQADTIISVNSQCLDLIERPSQSNAIVIENGFDERHVQDFGSDTSPKTPLKFVHAGAFDHDRSPQALIAALAPDQHQLHHVGLIDGLEQLSDDEVLMCHGRLDYPDTLDVIAGCHCGIVFSSGHGFETPTKVYDYLAAGIDILVLQSEHGDGRDCALNSLLQGYPHAYFIRNTLGDITDFIGSYSPRRDRVKPDFKFNRESSTRRLIAHLLELKGGASAAGETP